MLRYPGVNVQLEATIGGWVVAEGIDVAIACARRRLTIAIWDAGTGDRGQRRSPAGLYWWRMGRPQAHPQLSTWPGWFDAGKHQRD
nr:hypothetical protein [Raoultella ornithinolytica]